MFRILLLWRRRNREEGDCGIGDWGGKEVTVLKGKKMDCLDLKMNGMSQPLIQSFFDATSAVPFDPHSSVPCDPHSSVPVEPIPPSWWKSSVSNTNFFF